MKTTKKVMSIVLAALMTSGFAMAQKANVKGAEKIADKKGDYNEARALIKAALENEETKGDPKTMYVAGYVEESNFSKATRGSRARSCSNEQSPSRHVWLLYRYHRYGDCRQWW